jgi:type I restriction enzyme, S subunit
MDVNPGYRLTEVGVIPEEWLTSTVGGEFEIKLGKMLDAVKNVGVLKPYLSNKSVQWDRIDVDKLSSMAMSRSDLERFRLRNGDLLVCEGGEVGRAAIWEAPIDECYYQKALHRLRPVRGFNVRLMLALLRYWVEHGLLANHVTQTSIAHLTREKFAAVPMPVPSPEEQCAIAGMLRNVDALIAALDEFIAKKRDLKQAVMQQLLTGQRRLPGFQGEWKDTTLGEIGECFIGLTYRPEDVAENGLLVLRASNVQNSRITYDNNVFVDRRVPEHLITRPGDILICVRNGSRTLIGKCARIDEDSAGLTFGAFMSVYRTSHSAFLFQVFQAHCIQKQIQENIGATINQITNKDLKAFRVRIPAADEQAAIATVLCDMDSEIAAIERRCDKMHTLKQGMMHELLTGRTRLV